MAKRLYGAKGFTLGRQTPFQDVDVIAVLNKTARQYGLRQLSDLKKVPNLSLAGFPEFKTRWIPQLAKLYGVRNIKFVPLASISAYQLLDRGQVLAADVFTTDPPLATNRKYTQLKDPKNMFGFQHVAPIVSKQVLAENPGMLAALNAVTAKLTPEGDDRHEHGGHPQQEVAAGGRRRLPQGQRAHVVGRCRPRRSRGADDSPVAASRRRDAAARSLPPKRLVTTCNLAPRRRARFRATRDGLLQARSPVGTAKSSESRIDVVSRIARRARLWQEACAVRIAIVAQRSTPTNERLAARGARQRRVAQPDSEEAITRLEPGDVAIGRLDVRPTVDGVEDGVWALGELEARGVRVLNGPPALLASHDKLLTAKLLRRAGLPHPRTRLVVPGGALRAPGRLAGPSSSSRASAAGAVGSSAATPPGSSSAAGPPTGGEGWFRRHGALVQTLVPPLGHDLRLVVAGGKVVGAVTRVAAPGEWRTNVALGARRLPVRPPAEACALAIAAAGAAGADLVGVDLLPREDGGWVVLELNGAVEFTSEYDLDGDVFSTAALALYRAAFGCPAGEEQALA